MAVEASGLTTLLLATTHHIQAPIIQRTLVGTRMHPTATMRLIPTRVTRKDRINHASRLWAGEESAQMIALHDGCSRAAPVASRRISSRNKEMSGESPIWEWEEDNQVGKTRLSKIVGLSAFSDAYKSLRIAPGNRRFQFFIGSRV